MKIELLCRCRMFPALSPNAPRKLHWGHKKYARQHAKSAAESALTTIPGTLIIPLPTPIHYTVEVGLAKGQKTNDDDNAKANGTLKKIRDTFADILTAGSDKHWIMDDLTQVRDPAGAVYILFTLEAPDDGLRSTPVSG